MAMTCKLCGTEIKENETVCSLCGTAVENTSATVEEKPAPAVEKTSAPVVETSAPAVEEVKPEPVAAAPAAESKFVCSGCGKEYPAGTKFCAECGGKIEEKKPVIVQKEEAPKFVCSGCGKEYPAGTKFCAECGGKVEEVKPVAPVVFACTGCGKEYPAGTKFCSECGGKVAEKSAAQPVKKIVCTKCGKEYPDGGKFCAECGGKIEETIVYPNDAPTFYRVILTSLGNNEDRFEEVMYKTVNFYDSEKDFFFDKIILAHAILMEDAEKLVSLVEKAGGKALIEEFSDIPDPDGVVYKCRYCGELYDHDVTVCNSCDDETIEKSIRRDVWIKNAYHNERCVSALLPSDYRYFCWDCFRLSNTPEKCCGHVYDALQIRFCNLLSNNHNATAAYLLDKYPDLANGDCSYSPWWYVRDIESARKLVKNCTDINSSLLHDGIRYLRTAEFAKLIIDAGANKDALTHLLNSVHEQDDIAFAQVLINAGADVGSLDVELLAMGVEVEILKLFLDNGADPNLCDDCFGSVLNTRIRERDNDLESIELLLQRGADPNMLTEREDLDEEDNVIAAFKETSLEYAVDISSSIEIIKLLIKYGADVNVKHYDGRSLVDMALDNGDVEIAELLKQHGAVAHETPMTAAEIVEEYFPSSKMKFYSTAINFAPNFPMCTTPPHEDTIAIVSDEYRVVFFNKAGIYIRARKEGPGSVDRFMNNLLGGKVKDVDFAWQDIYSIDYSRSLGVSSININQNFILSDADAAATEQFANNLKNYAREQGAKL